jgi:hypothetical protein
MPEISIYKSNPIVQIIAGANTGMSGVTSASNLGAGAGVFSSKVGNDLQFKSLVAGANIGITSDATTITIANTAPGFVLTDGSGTTAAGTAVNLGGTLSGNVNINGAFSFNLGPSTPLTTFTSKQTSFFRVENTTSGGTNTILNLRSQTNSYFTFWDFSPTSVYTGNGPSFQLGGTNVISLLNATTGALDTAGSSLAFENVGTPSGFGQWIFGAGGLSALNPNGAGSSGYIVEIRSGVKNTTSGSNNAKALNIIPVLNYNVAGTHIFTGIDYNPTLTSTTGLATHYAALFRVGSVGIGTATPTARLHLAAGTATASTAPLKLTTGTALGTPEDGVFEYHTSHLYFTIGAVRYQLDQQTTPAWLLASGGTLTGANTVVGTTSNIIKFAFASLNAVQTDGAGLWLQNSTAAAAGAQQISPSITWEGQGWKTNATAGSQSVRFTSYVLPVQGTASPSGSWAIASSINGAAYTETFNLTSTGSTWLKTANAAYYLNTSQYLGMADESGQGIRIGAIGAGSGTGWFTKIVDNANATVIATFGQASGEQCLAIGTSTLAANLYVSQVSVSSAWRPALRVDDGAHVSMTASTEFPDIVLGGLSTDTNTAVSTRTATWLAGTVTTQRSVYVRGTVLTGASATAIFSDAYTVYIDPPTAGSNATVTRAWTLGMAGPLISTLGQSQFGTATNTARIGINTAPSGGVLQILGTAGLSTISIQSSSTAVTFLVDDSAGILAGSTTLVNSSKLTMRGAMVINANSQSSSWLSALVVTPGAHTSLTASTEFIAQDFATVTQTWLAGTVATQRFTYFRGVTIAGASATNTVTNAYTVYIDPPIAGTNATISNNYALGVNGNALFSGTPRVGIGGFNINSALNVVSISGQSGLTVYENTSSALVLSTNNVGTVSVGSVAFANATSGLNVAGFTSITGLNLATASPYSVLVVKPGAYTTIGNTTEVIDYDFGSTSSVTQTWAGGGTVTTNRTTYFRGRTLAGASAQTFTNAYTVYIDPPVAGTNGTITNNYALGINGKMRFQVVPTNDNAATDLLVRDSTTGEVKYRTVASLPGGGGWAVTGSTTITGNTTQTGAFTNTFALDGILITQNAKTSGTPTALTVTGGAHTGLTAGASPTDIRFALGRTVQLATGAVPLAAEVSIDQTTYAFVGASTINDAAILYLIGSPQAGANATILRSWSMIAVGPISVTGKSYFGNNFISANSTVEIEGSFGPSITSVSATTTLDATHYTVKVDASGAARTINLPAAGSSQRRVYIIKKIDSSANTVTIDANSTETIDGALTKVINTQWAGYQIQSDGTNWMVIATF